MLKNNVSIRTCVYLNKKFPKSELIRLIKEQNKLIIDLDESKPGRGYWIKLTPELINNPKTLMILSKKTKTKVEQSFIDELQKILKK